MLQQDAGFRSEGDGNGPGDTGSVDTYAGAWTYFGLPDVREATSANSHRACWLIRPKLSNITSITLSFARFWLRSWTSVLRVYDGRCAARAPVS